MSTTYSVPRLLYNDFASSSSIALKDCKVLLSSIHCIDLLSPFCLVTFFSSAEIENSKLNSYFFSLLSIKCVCNRAVTYQTVLTRNSGESILAIDRDSVNKNFCLAPDVKMVRPKNCCK